jgi:phosphoglycerol transferase MdoB-like AlkP superfamily enzyme
MVVSDAIWNNSPMNISRTLATSIDVDKRRLLVFAAASVILPNLFIELAQLYFGFHRSYVNLDYLVALVVAAMPHALARMTGIMIFIMAAIIDYALILMEYFPTLTLKDVPYLLGFLLSADRILILLSLIILIGLAATILLCRRLVRKAGITEPLVVFSVCALCHVLMYLAEPLDTSLIKNRFSESRTAFFVDNKNRNFLSILNAEVLFESSWQSAIQPWWDALEQGRGLNGKLLLIIAESWGEPNNEAAQEAVLRKLKDRIDHFEFFRQGSFQFLGLTVQGELRELCRLDTTSLDLREVKTGFRQCFPNQLKKLGYKTHAIHNATNFMYGRDSWYKLAGFQETHFRENLDVSRHCVPFDGICDWDILPVLRQQLAGNEKIFSYWLTLTSHFYYAESDIHDRRFQCADYGIPEGDACRNLRHQAQFFDNLAKIIDTPEMRGVEIIVVGDHVPPVFGYQDLIFKRENPSSRKADVAWIHFKIKSD